MITPASVKLTHKLARTAIYDFTADNTEVGISVSVSIPVVTAPRDKMTTSAQLFVSQESNSHLRELEYFVTGSSMLAHCSSLRYGIASTRSL